ncbi:MAG: hypothetical protein RLZZ419_320, partial [Pseudomonadota bacterium]
MSPLPSLTTLFKRLKNKNLKQIIRFIFTRLPLISIIGNLYFYIKYRTNYYHHINRRAYRLYDANQNYLSAYSKQIVASIKFDGVYAGDIRNICGSTDIMEGLIKDSRQLLKQVLDKPRENNKLYSTKLAGIGRDVQGVCLPDSFALFFLSDNILNIVNSCHSMLLRLNYIDTWLSIPTANNIVNYTEGWHRDHEDLKMIKIFIYLTNVDETMGPFSYLKESQHGA